MGESLVSEQDRQGNLCPGGSPGRPWGQQAVRLKSGWAWHPSEGLLPWHGWSFVRTGNCCFKSNKIDLSAPTRRHHGTCPFPLTLQRAQETPNIVKVPRAEGMAKKKKKKSLCEYWIKCANHIHTHMNNVQSLYEQTCLYTHGPKSLCQNLKYSIYWVLQYD